jgi:hypothetical protein
MMNQQANTKSAGATTPSAVAQQATIQRAMPRRTMLRGAGVAMALPLLNAMIGPNRSTAASSSRHALRSDDDSLPRRSVFVYIPNGVNMETWRMDTAGKDYQLSAPLASLARHRGSITPFSGLHHPGALHQQHVCADSWLTAAPLTNGSGAEKYRNSISVDQLIAEKTAEHTRFASLELSIAAGVGQPYNSSTLSFSRDGAPLPAEDNPRAVFDRLFGIDDSGISAQRAKLVRQRSILDAVIESAGDVRRRVGSEDVAKLDEYLTAVRDVERRLERLDRWLDIPKPSVDGARFQRNVSREQAGDFYRTMYDLIVLALRTDMTRVVTYASGTEGNGLAIPEIGIKQTRHELSHHNEAADVKQSLTRSDTFLVDQFAYFLDQLQSIREEDQSLLDQTMVLFGSGMSYGHSHGNANLPIVFAGGMGLGLRHGQHIDYNLAKRGSYQSLTHGDFLNLCFKPTDDRARLSNLLLTILQSMAVDADSFVDSTGPISEVLA